MLLFWAIEALTCVYLFMKQNCYKKIKKIFLHPIYYISNKTTLVIKGYTSKLKVLAILKTLCKFRIYVFVKYKVWNCNGL